LMPFMMCERRSQVVTVVIAVVVVTALESRGHR
jgi:hypothetical protein